MTDDMERSFNRTIRIIEDDIARYVNEIELSSGCLEPLHQIKETSDYVIVSFDLPGVERQNVKISATQRTLTIEASCMHKSVWRQSNSIKREFVSFKKIITLPSRVEPSSAKAVYKKGILEIKFKKIEEGVKIEIT